ncbi:hypothetical protein KW404_21580, partial [Xanthomonas vasicola pv. vasculorum]|nr:hypothetical protein [Xanthomonas vasicola pv. vasculorum]
GEYRVAAHTAVGLLGGGVQGALGSATAATAAPMLNELTKNLPDGVREAVGAGLAAGLGAATGGAAGAGTAFNADSNNRQLHQVEAKALDRLKEGKSEEEQYRLTAAACAYVQCADGVPTDDPQYAALKQLQLDGAGYTAERSAIEKTGAFEQYGPVAYATDLRTSHEEAVTRTKGAFGAIGGALGVVGGYQMAAGAAVFCPETGLSCLGIPAGIGLATLSYGQGQDGVAQLTGPYTSTQGLEVLGSFNPKRPDGWNPLAQDAVDLGILGLQTLIFKGGEKVITGKVAGGSKPDLAEPVQTTGATRSENNSASGSGNTSHTTGSNTEVVDLATVGIEWGKGIQGQGMPWENYLETQMPEGSRLPPNFKTFDFFDGATGIATSAKTLDTNTMAKISDPRQVYSSLKGNIDAAANFTNANLVGVNLSSAQITSRELRLAVPSSTTAAQWDQIERALKYAKDKGVIVKITRIN